MAISTGFMVNPSLYAKVPYDPVKDFAPVTLVGGSPNVVVVNPSVPAKTLHGTGAARSATIPASIRSPAPASARRRISSGELFRLAFNLDLIHVPFTGAGPAIQATLGGHTPIAFTALPPALAAVKDGKLRALGVATPTTRRRDARRADLRASRAIKDQESDTLTGLVVPAGTPKDIVDLLQREIAKAVAQPDVKEKLAALGFVPVANTPEEFGERIKAEIEKWGKVVRDAKLRVE